MLRISAHGNGGEPRRPSVSIALLLATLGISTASGVSPAQAQPRLGSPGQLAITGEDLTGYFAVQRKYYDSDGVENTDRTSHLSLLVRDGAHLGAYYFVLPGLSVGATLGYESRTGSVTVPDGGGTWTRDKATDSTWLVLPKVGYALMVSEMVGFWFRAGPGVQGTVTHPIWDPNYKARETHWLVDLDALVTLLPVPHFGAFLGPTADFSLAGSHGETGPRGDVWVDYNRKASYRRLGGTLGLLGTF
jgi:hypothetical protein